MIELRGTSHIASGDLTDIRALVEEEQPDVVALELDPRRLAALVQEHREERMRNPFLKLLKTAQDLLGKKTGAVPGSDMLAAYETAVANGIDVALIDQDITETLRKLRNIPLLEKVKFAGFLVVGSFLRPLDDIDPRQVPDERLVEELMVRFRVSFPHLYEVLVAERNRLMADRLQLLDTEYDEVLAFVGAGHVHGIRKLLDEA